MKELYELEKERLSLLVKLQLSSVLAGFLGLIAFAIFYYYMQKEVFLSAFVGVFSAVFLYAFIRSFLTRDYNLSFKNIAMIKLIKSIDENLTYEPENFIKFEEFYYPNIYKKPHTYSGNDLISGKFNGVNLKFSDNFLQERVEEIDEKGSVEVKYHTIFKGICFIAEFNKNFTSKTYVLSPYIGINLDKFEMDNSEFEKSFNVYGSDKINAFYILTPSLMEKILNLRSLFNVPLNLAFIDNKIYIYIEFGKDSFEPDVRQSLIGENSLLLRYKAEILALLNIVNELNLNRQIWKN